MLKLVRLEERYMPLLIDMMDEWKQAGEKIIPGILRGGDYHDFENFSASGIGFRWNEATAAENF